MTEKRYRTEQIEGATLPFIVDNYSAKKHKTMTGYKAYDTTTLKKCDELTDLLNNYENKCNKKQEHIVILENKIRRMRGAIHKLEWLASHRNADLMRENEQLKKEYNLANRFHSLDKSKYDAVVKENDQLRNQMSISDDTINDLISEIEQLKSELRIKIVK